jgi:hypothetical protein
MLKLLHLRENWTFVLCAYLYDKVKNSGIFIKINVAVSFHQIAVNVCPTSGEAASQSGNTGVELPPSLAWPDPAYTPPPPPPKHGTRKVEIIDISYLD